MEAPALAPAAAGAAPPAHGRSAPGSATAARIAIRLAYRPLPLPDAIRGMERTAAHLGHAALYALPALVIAVGWAETNFGGHTVQWFGVGMPRVFPETGEALQDLSADLHKRLARTMPAVAASTAATSSAA